MIRTPTSLAITATCICSTVGRSDVGLDPSWVYLATRSPLQPDATPYNTGLAVIAKDVGVRIIDYRIYHER